MLRAVQAFENPDRSSLLSLHSIREVKLTRGSPLLLHPQNCRGKSMCRRGVSVLGELHTLKVG